MAGSVTHVPKNPSRGISNHADRTFMTSSMQLETTGAAFLPMACIAERRQSSAARAGKNERCSRRLSAALCRVSASEEPVMNRTSAPPNIHVMQQANMDHSSSIPITFFSASLIRPGFFAPQFCPTKVELAVAIVAKG